MNKYWNRNNDCLAKLLLDMGKHRARKDTKKLLKTVNTIKKKYNSLRQACRLTDISWSKFHRHTYINSEVWKKLKYSRKLTAGQIEDIQAIYNNDDVSFPLPDKKNANKRFLRTSVTKCAKMYNMLATTTHKISTVTFYKYKPKAVKLQGCIPFRQSCCENVIDEAAKYLHGVPHDIDNVIDRTMCAYVEYFPKLPCILGTCDNCGEAKYQEKLLDLNRDKLSDKRKQFMVKIWITKTKRKEGKVQSFLDWKFERCTCVDLINLLTNHIKSMAEHSFMASWNYWQYKLTRRTIIQGDIIMVHDFVQNYLCSHQNEVQGLHWHHKQVTVRPTVVHYLCPPCQGNVTHEIVHVTEDLKHDATRSEQIPENSGIMIRKIIEFANQTPSQYKKKQHFIT